MYNVQSVVNTSREFFCYSWSVYIKRKRISSEKDNNSNSAEFSYSTYALGNNHLPSTAMNIKSNTLCVCVINSTPNQEEALRSWLWNFTLVIRLLDEIFMLFHRLLWLLKISFVFHGKWSFLKMLIIFTRSVKYETDINDIIRFE